MAEKTIEKSKDHYLVLEDLSYSKDNNLVTVKKNSSDDVYLEASDVPKEALSELIERGLVKVIAI